MIDREKLDELYDTLSQAAFDLLQQNGEFFPIGAVIRGDDIDLVAFDAGEEHPASQDVIDGLTEVFKGEAARGAISASAIAFDGRVRSQDTGKPTDAVIVRLRAAGYATDVFTPYDLQTRGLFKKTRTLQAGQAGASEGAQDVFV